MYDSALLEHDASTIQPGTGGSDIGQGGSGAGYGGSGGASTTPGSAGASGAGGAGGIGTDVASGGQGGAGTGGQAGQAGSSVSLDGAIESKDQASDSIVDAQADATADAPPETGCTNPTFCALKAALVHRYSFDGTGTLVTDSVGTAHGTVINAQLNGNGAVVLAGGVTDQYVDLPNGIIKQLTNATFEVWLTWNGGAAWQRILDFGDTGGVEGVRGEASSSFYLTPQAMTGLSFPGPAVMVVGFKRADQLSIAETHVIASTALATGAIAQIALVVDDANNQMALYRNGTFEGSIAFSDSLSILNDVNNWLGRSQYSPDPGFNGTIDEFRIYGAALSEAAVQASFAAGTNPPFLN